VTACERVRRTDATAWIYQLVGKDRKNDSIKVLSTASAVAVDLPAGCCSFFGRG
jgi:hypothetical protein